MSFRDLFGIAGCSAPSVDDGSDAGLGEVAQLDDGGSDDVIENEAPTAHAGEDVLVPVGELIALDGSESSDPDGDTLTFVWAFADVPSGSAAALAAPHVVNPTFTPDLAGSYLVKLSVDDGAAASTPDVVEVVAVPRARPIASAGPDGSILLDQVFALDGTESTAAGGGALSYAWRIVERPDVVLHRRRRRRV